MTRPEVELAQIRIRNLLRLIADQQAFLEGLPDGGTRDAGEQLLRRYEAALEDARHFLAILRGD